jgi:hypothetical protein
MTKKELVEALEDAETIVKVWQRHVDVFPQLDGISKLQAGFSWEIHPVTRQYLTAVGLLKPARLHCGMQGWTSTLAGWQCVFSGLSGATIGAAWLRIFGDFPCEDPWMLRWKQFGYATDQYAKRREIRFHDGMMFWEVPEVSSSDWTKFRGWPFAGVQECDSGRYCIVSRKIIIRHAVTDDIIGAFFAKLKYAGIDGVQYVVD